MTDEERECRIHLLLPSRPDLAGDLEQRPDGWALAFRSGPGLWDELSGCEDLSEPLALVEALVAEAALTAAEEAAIEAEAVAAVTRFFASADGVGASQIGRTRL